VEDVRAISLVLELCFIHGCVQVGNAQLLFHIFQEVGEFGRCIDGREMLAYGRQDFDGVTGIGVATSEDAMPGLTNCQTVIKNDDNSVTPPVACDGVIEDVSTCWCIRFSRIKHF
jgi:hypothetical protein